MYYYFCKKEENYYKNVFKYTDKVGIDYKLSLKYFITNVLHKEKL